MLSLSLSLNLRRHRPARPLPVTAEAGCQPGPGIDGRTVVLDGAEEHLKQYPQISSPPDIAFAEWGSDLIRIWAANTYKQTPSESVPMMNEASIQNTRSASVYVFRFKAFA